MARVWRYQGSESLGETVGNFFFGLLGGTTTTVQGASFASWQGSGKYAGMKVIFSGSGFTYDAMGNLTGGTINSTRAFDSSGKFIFNTVQLGLDAADFWNGIQQVIDTGRFDSYLAVTNPEPWIFRGSVESDRFSGGDRSDVLRGLSGNDELFGRGGSDRIEGGTGRDSLDGGDGNDFITGGRENDVMIGGRGRDIFIFSTGDGTDRIEDFSAGRSGSSDRINLRDQRFVDDFNDLLDNHAYDLRSGDLLILYGGSRIILEDVQKADLESYNFIF